METDIQLPYYSGNMEIELAGLLPGTAEEERLIDVHAEHDDDEVDRNQLSRDRIDQQYAEADDIPLTSLDRADDTPLPIEPASDMPFTRLDRADDTPRTNIKQADVTPLYRLDRAGDTPLFIEQANDTPLFQLDRAGESPASSSQANNTPLF